MTSKCGVLDHEADRINFETQTYCLLHGLLMGIRKLKHSSDATQSFDEAAYYTPLTAVHTPVTLFPSAFPRQCFEQARDIAPLLSLLVDKISRDYDFLVEHLNIVCESDSFTKRLLDIFIKVHKEGITQKVALGVHRSDYMLHQGEKIQQIEINTISSSFGCLTSLTSPLHKNLISKYESFSSLDPQNIPDSQSINAIPNCLAAAHKYQMEKNGYQKGSVLFLVQSNERNFADQKFIEQKLWEDHQINVIRMTLGEVYQHHALDEETKILKVKGEPITVVYFRAGYTPDDYPTENEWTVRELLERSHAIKCPNIGYHLAGTKKIQQVVLARNGQLERFFPDDPKSCELIRATCTGLWGLDNPNPSEDDIKVVHDAIANPRNYVLKPQREGGGNLIHGEKMKELLQNGDQAEKQQYVLMQRISPTAQRTQILRGGQISEGNGVSEMGIYCLFLGTHEQVLLNEYGGHLLRTKMEEQEDGGVASGVAVLDSLYLI